MGEGEGENTRAGSKAWFRERLLDFQRHALSSYALDLPKILCPSSLSPCDAPMRSEQKGSSQRQPAGDSKIDPVSFQRFNVEEWAQPLEDLNFQRAFRSERMQWFWDLRPSI